MRDAAIVEIGIRETMTRCEQAEIAYSGFAGNGAQDTTQTFFLIDAFLTNCAAVARLAWSQEFAPHTGGKTLAQYLDLPSAYHLYQDTVREIVDHYDRRLVRGLAARGEVEKILDRNIGDRDAFEQEFGVFLRHYDASVKVLTLMEEEIDLQRLSTEIADIRARAGAWLVDNAVFEDRPAEVVIRPGEVGR